MYLCGSSTRRVSNDDIASASVIPSLFACSAIASAVSCLSNSSDGTVVGLPQSRYSGSRSERESRSERKSETERSNHGYHLVVTTMITMYA